MPLHTGHQVRANLAEELRVFVLYIMYIKVPAAGWGVRLQMYKKL